jgi:hypothetical protein
MTRRRARRRKQLLDDLKETKGCWKLKEGALKRTPWRNHFGRGMGPLLGRLQSEWMGELTDVEQSTSTSLFERCARLLQWQTDRQTDTESAVILFKERL